MDVLKDTEMRMSSYSFGWLVVFLTACSITQKPASVSEGSAVAAPVIEASQPVASSIAVPQKTVQPVVAPASRESLTLSALPAVAKSVQKNSSGAKKYAGETLTGQAKFVKAPKGNPNAAVADVRVVGLGEVSLWCRNVVGDAPAGRLMSFEGTLTGSVYTSEDFSHDVTMKDCRFHD